MSHKTKLEEIRREIRKQHISEIFLKKRILFMQSKSSLPEIPLVQVPNLQQLKIIARAAQSEPQIQQLHRQGWLNILMQFTESCFNGTQEQIYASSALCNLLIVGQSQPPSPKLTANLMEILSSNCIPAVSNVLSMCFNLIYDHVSWCEDIITHYSFIEIVNRLFLIEGVDWKFSFNLLRTIKISLYTVRPTNTQMMVMDSLLNLLPLADSELLYQTLSSIYIICSMFPKESAVKIVESRFVSKLSPSVKVSNEERNVELFLSIAQTVCNQLSCKDFATHLFPLIKNRKTTSRRIQLLSYKLLYSALQEQLMSLSEFWKDPLREQMLVQFSQTDDRETLIQFCHIFSLCLLNLGLRAETLKELKQLLYRASKILRNDVQIQGFIEEIIYTHNSLNCP